MGAAERQQIDHVFLKRKEYSLLLQFKVSITKNTSQLFAVANFCSTFAVEINATFDENFDYMEIAREKYVSELLDRRHNHLVKIITGIRRCGKSYLLNKLFRDRILQLGVREDHIISIALDDFAFRQCLNPSELYQYVMSKVKDKERYYVLLDEIQLVSEFESVLNGFLHIENLDTYVTGSNSRFLSSDIITEFRGRGDEVRIAPLCFSEFCSGFQGTPSEAWEQYSVYGGMPGLLEIDRPEHKVQYLNRLFEQTYFQDIINRYHLRGNEEMSELVNVIASSVGQLTNPYNLTNAFNSQKHLHLSNDTVTSYIQYMQDAFLISKALRYDIRGKHFIGSPMKYYFVDVGLRNARLNFRQKDLGSVMENVIYNELTRRGFGVDVGLVEIAKKENGKTIRKQYEVDFVCNRGSERYYVQSAYDIGNEEKRQQENQSLIHINDSFKKILIVKDSIIPYYDNNGFYNMGLLDFLLQSDL